MKLKITDLSKKVGSHALLHKVSVDLDFGVLGIIGPSGGGKSTFLRLIAGLVEPTSGEILLNQKRIPFENNQELINHRRSLGVVFQSWNLFPHLSALDNIVLPLHEVHGNTREEAVEKGEALLKRFGLEADAHKKPHELSGGQCQRVAIIRAVANKPFLLLLDEPTSALDPLMTSEVLDLIVELKKEGISFLLVSHHINFLMKVADSLIFIDRGLLIESGSTKELLSHPKEPQVADYLSKVLKY
ncbi:MAG: amino acid ABC transporter ATP-binding protein [Chlamydiales bacterium]|nr:amino acid ABC transporter ATP-binding protein [Chlamydiales bacterium]